MIIGQAQFIAGINNSHGAPPDIKKLKGKIFIKLLNRETLIYLLMEMGEICIGPVVYSLVSKLSPKQIASTLMGIMFLSISLGEYLSGKLGAFMTVPEGISGSVEMMPYFSSVFIKIGVGSLLIAVLIIILIPVLRKWMQEVK